MRVGISIITHVIKEEKVSLCVFLYVYLAFTVAAYFFEGIVKNERRLPNLW